MNCIVACDLNWGIGKDNNLLCHLPGDLKYFKEKTTNKTIIIGRKTLDSFPGGKPLLKRINLVLTSDSSLKGSDNLIYCLGINELKKEIEKYKDDDIYICGGELIYKLFAFKCKNIYVTKIFDRFDANKHFPNVDENKDYIKTWESEIFEDNKIKYQFIKYERR